MFKCLNGQRRVVMSLFVCLSVCSLAQLENHTAKLHQLLARDVEYIHLALMLRCQCPSVRLSVTEVHCGHGACREEGRGHLALC